MEITMKRHSCGTLINSAGRIQKCGRRQMIMTRKAMKMIEKKHFYKYNLNMTYI